MTIEVLRPGVLTTLQDRGRHGCAMLGVGRAGAMDDAAMRLANALAGNVDGAPVLEITLSGPTLRFDASAAIALTGAEFSLRIDGTAAPMWQRVAVEAGRVLEIRAARRGARAWLAVEGGFAADAVLGSVSTDVNARLGGLDGRALRERDRLALGTARLRAGDGVAPAAPIDVPVALPSHWSLDPRPWFAADAATPIRVMRGTHFEALDAASRRALFEGEFRLGADSNRVGFRLDGPRLALTVPIEMVSEPLAVGTLQLPPGGQCIALMAEHPTVGGYPRIGQIAAIDLPRFAQRRPGDRVRFAEIGLDEAQTRYLEREHALARLIEAIGERLNR